VIGKGGANVKKIVNETHTQVVIAKDLDPNLNETSNEYWTRVSLIGGAEQTFSAYKVIHKIVDDVDGVVGEFKMKKWGHFIILGKGHETIKRLSADHQVRINVPDHRKEPDNSKVQLEGEVESVEKVYKSILHEINIQSKKSGSEKRLEKALTRDSKKRTSKRVETELTITPEDFEKLSAREDFNWTKLHRMVKTAFHVSARNKETGNGTSDKDSTSTEGTTTPALVPTSVAEKSSQVFILSGEEFNVESAIKTIRELIEDETKNPRDMFYERAIPRNKSEKRRYDKQYLKARRLADSKNGNSSEVKQTSQMGSNGKGKQATIRKGLTSKGSRRKRQPDAENTADTGQDSERGPSNRKENSGRRGRGKGKNSWSEGGAAGKGKGRGGSGRGGGSTNKLVFKPKQNQGGDRNGDTEAPQQAMTKSNLGDSARPLPAKGSNNSGSRPKTGEGTAPSS